MKYILYGLSGSFVYWYYICCWYQLANRKIAYKDYKLYLGMIIFDFFGTASAFLLPPALKMLIVTILLCWISYTLVFKDLKKSIIATLIVQIILSVCEAIFVLVSTGVFSMDVAFFTENSFGIVIMNFIIAMLALFTIKLKITYSSFSFFMNLATKIEKNKLIKYSSLVIMIAIFFTTTIYMKLSFQQILLFNTLIIVFYVWLVLKISNSEIKYDEIEKNYMVSKETLKNSEQEIDNYMVSNHEMKNGLKTLRDMLKKKDKNAEKYLNELINDIQIESDTAKIAYRIPFSGVKSIVHDKFCEMDQKGIPYQLYIARNVKASKFLDLTEKDVMNICKILGVYLDNAIYETARINIEEKTIYLEFYIEESFVCISITNSCKNVFELQNINKNQRYTTKGKGHGYGLQLVKNIVDSNDRFKTETEISSSTFTQTLKIKV